MSDGSLAQPMQARLSATFEAAPPSSTAGGGAVAALAASLSAFSAASASRTSFVAAPRSGCCSRSLASSGLKPRSGSAMRRPRTASRRASDVQGSHMRRGRWRAARSRRARVFILPLTRGRLPCERQTDRQRNARPERGKAGRRSQVTEI
eukprot:scaffold105570_cov36-Phaeocystis_antarctica.AAC.1